MKSDIRLNLPVEHYLVYDIKENAEELITVYSRLSSNYPNHKDFKYWRTRFQYWIDYKYNIKNMGIDTLEKVSDEIDRTYAETRLMLDLEKELRIEAENNMTEKEYLLSNKANAERLRVYIKQAEEGTDLIQGDTTKD